MGPVRQNPIQRTVRTAHLSVPMTVHNFQYTIRVMRIGAASDDDDDDIGIAVFVGSSAAGAVRAAAPAMRDVTLSCPAPDGHSVCAVRACTRPAICHAKTNSAAAVPRIRAPGVC